jgi:hypothetical protein
MPTLSGWVVLYLRLPVDRWQALREQRRVRRQRATADLNMRRVDTAAFPMLREPAPPRTDAPPKQETHQ